MILGPWLTEGLGTNDRSGNFVTGGRAWTFRNAVETLDLSKPASFGATITVISASSESALSVVLQRTDTWEDIATVSLDLTRRTQPIKGVFPGGGTGLAPVRLKVITGNGPLHVKITDPYISDGLSGADVLAWVKENPVLSLGLAFVGYVLLGGKLRL